MEQKTMNMISTGTFHSEMGASDRQKNLLVNKLVSAWEQKNSKTARAGGVSLMALSLAACGSSDDSGDSASYSQVQLDTAKTAAAATALTDSNSTVHASVDAAIISNDAAIAAAVDITTDNAAVAAAVDITTDNAAVAAAVDITTDNAAAVSLSLRDAAANLSVPGTSTMTDAELITAIKQANDTDVAAAVDTSVDDAAAINAAVLALGYAGVTTLTQLNTAYDLLLNPAVTTFTLTTGVNSGSSFTGSTADDTFDASTSNSLSNNDVLDGGAGTDTLTASLNGASVAVNMKAIENVTFTNVTAASTLNMASATGITSVSNVSSTADLTLNNMQSVPTVTINTNAVATTLNFANTALASATDSMTINVQGVSDAGGGGTGDIVLTRAAGATNDLETLNVNSSVVANTIEGLTTGAVDVTTLNISGDQDLGISDTLDVDITTVNASTFTGGLTAILSGTTTTFTGGSGADSITVGGSDDLMTMGGGNDTITMATLDL
jgi:hypothetical protein